MSIYRKYFKMFDFDNKKSVWVVTYEISSVYQQIPLSILF